MPQTTTQDLVIVTSSFNEDITSALVDGAVQSLANHGLSASVLTVAGAFELPVVARHVIVSGATGVIALGCVIRGDTVHFDYVCRGCTDGLMQVMLDYGTPIGFGVLMTENIAQARLRASRDVMTAAGDHNQEAAESNKGYEAAEAVIATLNTLSASGVATATTSAQLD